MAVYLGNNKITFDGISEIYVGSNKVYSAAPVDYSTEYFFVENLTNSDNALSIKKSDASAPTITVYRSVDKTTWVSMGDTDTTEITYTIPANSRVYLKATTNKWSTSSNYNSITCSENYAVGGNIMSLIYGDSFIGQTVFPSSSTYNLSKIFYNSTYLKNIDNLVLPATTLTNSCYSHMFRGTSITSIPSNLLPATTLASSCYNSMFFGCTRLTTIPSTLLPATTLASSCYNSMFRDTSLTSIPSTLLPATTLGGSCYSGMFQTCKGLTSIPSNLLPATTLQSSCYSGMFSYCTGLTTIPSDLLPATTLGGSCYYQMFRNCTSLTKAPELPATTLQSSCYSNMFNGCTSLTTAPELPATTLQSSCYNNMFRNCSSLNEITCSANDIPVSNCTTGWVDGVASSGTFHKRGDAAWTTGVNGIPTGWTVINDKPYFYVENLTNSDNTLSIKKSSYPAPTIDVYRSTDKTTWTYMGTTSTTAITYSIPANSKVYLKATTDKWCSSSYVNSITCSGNFAVGGNIMSLLYGDNFIGKIVFPSSSTYNFARLFYNITNLKSISNLVLPATTLTNYCYQNMFYGTGITSIPSNLLPATTLATYCYDAMFGRCSGLTSIPSNLLRSTTLAERCYSSMFQNCTGLTTIPSNFLPATILTNYCYHWMFYGCTGLTSIPSDLLPATTLAYSCYGNMFNSCSNLVSTPILPATTLISGCYQSMFSGCTKLNNVIISADDISASDCLSNWLSNVASTGTFHKWGSATYRTGSASGIPTGWSVVEDDPRNITIEIDSCKSYKIIVDNSIEITETTKIALTGVHTFEYVANPISSSTLIVNKFVSWDDNSTANPRTIDLDGSARTISYNTEIDHENTYFYIKYTTTSSGTIYWGGVQYSYDATTTSGGSHAIYKMYEDDSSWSRLSGGFTIYNSKKIFFYSDDNRTTNPGYTPTQYLYGTYFFKSVNGGYNSYIYKLSSSVSGANIGGEVEIGGNILSLWWGSNFRGKHSFPTPMSGITTSWPGVLTDRLSFLLQYVPSITGYFCLPVSSISTRDLYRVFGTTVNLTVDIRYASISGTNPIDFSNSTSGSPTIILKTGQNPSGIPSNWTKVHV